MRLISRSFTAPALLVVALVLSSCVGTVVQSAFVPQDRSAAAAGSASIGGARTALYVQSTATVSTSSSADSAIPGMSITLPAATTSLHNALVTFSAGGAGGNGYCQFKIYSGTTPTSATAFIIDSYTAYSTIVPANLVERIPLTTTTQDITVDYNNQNNGTCTVYLFYSLSAILTG